MSFFKDTLRLSSSPVSDVREGSGRAAALDVLVVDLNATRALGLTEAVSKLGHSSRAAASTLVALELIAERRPDVVLLSLSAAQDDDCRMVSKLRNRLGAECAILAIIDAQGDDAREAARVAGVNGFILRAFAHQTIADVLDTLVRPAPIVEGHLPESKRTGSH